MDTSQIKKFAIAARKVLLKGVINKISTLGFDVQGNVTLAQMPVLAHNDTNFNGRIIPGTSFFHQWNALHKAIQQKGVKNVYEEVAYTWFNRLVAIRILQNQENQLIANVLDFVDDSNTPSIVNDARHGIMPSGMSLDTQNELNRLLGDDTKTTEQFAILISAFCESTPILRKIFGRIDDYTELLLPSDILAKKGFVDMLNNTDYITPEDYKQTELIGWLYQFYISERKDEVFESFKKKHKATADEVPAATQIFTPNWIVKYMVENTLGRIYLDNNPDSDLVNDMKYLVEQSEGEHPIFEFENMEDLRCADFSCGSGHILGEFFDMLYHIYTDEKWYDCHDAIESIFKNNIAGIDLDTRAMQLSTFALLLKACQKDESFINAEVMPNVLDMPSVTFDGAMPTVNELFCDFNEAINKEVTDAFRLIEKADELGSIMKFNLSDATREAMQTVVADYRTQTNADAEIVKSMDLMLMLTDKYSAICMNPPYMKSANMNAVLKNYVDSHYEEGNSDLYSVFMMMSSNHIELNGRFSMIVQPTWLVNSTFAGLRVYISNNSTLESLLHMGRGNFGNDWGSIAFTMGNYNSTIDTQFFKLYERTFYRIAPNHISSLFIAANGNHNARYDFSLYDTSSFNLNDLKSGRKLYYSCNVDRFNIIPNHPYCYSFNDDILNTIVTTRISHSFNPATGLQTGDNKRFIKQWTEISFHDFQTKWYPLVNGGEFRRWYGNFNDLIYWYNNGSDIRNNGSSVIRNQQYYLRQGITWNRIASRGITLRAFPEGCIFDQAGDSMFSDNLMQLFLCMGYLNSIVGKTFFEMLAPGLNLTAGVVGNLPYIDVPYEYRDEIIDCVKDNISYSKLDWDSHETSWDFKRSPIIEQQFQLYVDEVINTMPNLTIDDLGAVHMPELQQPIEILVENHCSMWEDILHKLHHNEEELNRKFIDIYGLQDELTPDVSFNDITILQEGEIKVIDNRIQWNKDEIIKQLISYAMGCWMGRYRLDRPGLHIAHPNPTEEELAGYNAYGKPFEIDDDGIIPLMGEDSPFPDNAVSRMKEFVAQVFGEENKAANIHFIEATLGRNMTLEKFFKKDFWKDHLRRYQKRPIYWLFQSSSPNPAFQVLVYMHRMDAYTCEKVRTYLLSYIEYLNNRIAYLESQTTTAAVTSELKTKREALKECTEYELRLHDVANQQIAFDLDDGVKANYAKFGDVLASVN